MRIQAINTIVIGFSQRDETVLHGWMMHCKVYVYHAFHRFV